MWFRNVRLILILMWCSWFRLLCVISMLVAVLGLRLRKALNYFYWECFELRLWDLCFLLMIVRRVCRVVSWRIGRWLGLRVRLVVIRLSIVLFVFVLVALRIRRGCWTRFVRLCRSCRCVTCLML